MIKEIIQLLPEKQRKRGIWVAFSVLLRAILDFAGVAALIPILLVVAKQDGGRGMMLALCGAVLLFVLLKNALVAFLARVQSRYQLEIYREFSRRMFANYYHRGLLFLKGKSSVQLGHEVNYVCYMFSSCVLAPVFCMAGEAVLVLLMVTALSASCAFMMPVGTPPNAIVFSTGRIKIMQMVSAGAVLTLVSVVVIGLFAATFID